MGFADSEHKRVSPTKVKSYTGIEINSTDQTCRVESKKVRKYTQAWQTLKEAASEWAVSRLNLASVVGKLQHTAPLVRGGHPAAAGRSLYGQGRSRGGLRLIMASRLQGVVARRS